MPKQPAKPALPPEQRANMKPSTMDAMTPQRQASMKLVDKGKAMLDANDPSRAADTLMAAVNIDSTNGVAYYYLAVANEKLGQHDVAMGLLDKAEALLGADDEWRARIDQMRGGMDASTPKPVVPSPIDVAF